MFIKFLVTSVLIGFSAQAGTPIIGGEEVSSSDPVASVTVGIALVSNDGSRGFCSGTIIDESHVLTAAHCAEGVASAKIIFQRTNMLSYDKDPDHETVRTVQKMQIGSGLPPLEERKRNEYNDLALFTFNGGLPVGYKAAQYYNVDRAQYEKIMSLNNKLVVAGYGKTSSTPMPAQAGKKPVQNLKKTTVQLTQFRPQGITFGVFSVRATTCNGDSGGPAFTVINGEYYLVGVLSRGDCYNSSLYTRFNGQLDQ